MELVQIGDNALSVERVKEFIQVLTHELENPFELLELMIGVKKIKIFENTIVFDINRDLLVFTNVHTVHMVYNEGADLYELKFFDIYGDLLEHLTDLYLDVVKEAFENFTTLILTIPTNVIFV